MAPSLQRLVEERLGGPVVLSYCLSEATCTCTMNPPDSTRRAGSVGRALDAAAVATAQAFRSAARAWLASSCHAACRA